MTLKSLKPILDRLCGGEDLTLLGGDDGVAWDKLSEDTTCRSSVSMARSTHTHLPLTSGLDTESEQAYTENYEKLTGQLNPVKILNLQKYLQLANILYN